METFDHRILVILGGLLLVGYAGHAAGARTHVPRVTILLLLGITAGPSLLDLVPEGIVTWFPLVAHLALAMVGFLLGERFYGRDLGTSGRVVLWVSLAQTVGVVALVAAAMLLLGLPAGLALVLGAIACATDAAAVLDLGRESHARGPLTRVVLGVVAIDDAWGILVFSFALVSAEALSGQGAPLAQALAGLWEVVGAVLLGIALGLPMAWLTGRVKRGEPTLLEAAGFVFLCGGLAIQMEVSYLLACMSLGATVANRARHHTRPFRDIEGVIDPFLVVFFLLAGYGLELETLSGVVLVLIAYILSRAGGKLAGGWIGARIAGAPAVIRQRVGWCLMPQAGIALGMALLVVERLPALADRVLPVVIASTVLFEVAGPLLTRWHLARAGELRSVDAR